MSHSRAAFTTTSSALAGAEDQPTPSRAAHSPLSPSCSTTASTTNKRCGALPPGMRRPLPARPVDAWLRSVSHQHHEIIPPTSRHLATYRVLVSAKSDSCDALLPERADAGPAIQLAISRTITGSPKRSVISAAVTPSRYDCSDSECMKSKTRSAGKVWRE